MLNMEIQVNQYRMKNWYWGNWVQQNANGVWIDEKGKPVHGVVAHDLIEYNEFTDGWKNSLEYKNGEENA